MTDRLTLANSIEGAASASRGVVLTVRLPEGGSPPASRPSPVRRAIAMVREHGPDAVTAIVQGRLVGS